MGNRTTHVTAAAMAFNHVAGSLWLVAYTLCLFVHAFLCNPVRFTLPFRL